MSLSLSPALSCCQCRQLFPCSRLHFAFLCVLFVVDSVVDVRGYRCFCASIECIFNKYFCFFNHYYYYMCYYFCFPSFISTINVTDIMCAKHHYAVDQLKFSKLKRVYVVCYMFVYVHCSGVIIDALHRSVFFIAANENIIELNFQLSLCVSFNS